MYHSCNIVFSTILNFPCFSDTSDSGFSMRSCGHMSGVCQVPVNTPATNMRNSNNLRVTNQELQIQAPTPTPSEVSTVAYSARGVGNGNLSYRSQISGINGSDKDTFLAPGQMLKQKSWNLSYGVVPPLSNNMDGESEHGMMQSSNNSLTPSMQYQEMYSSPSQSIQLTPCASARRGNKRAISTSSQSSDVDIMTMIRGSPSALIPCVNGSRGSSMNTSPQPGHQIGCLGHLMARPMANSTSNLAMVPDQRMMNKYVESQPQAAPYYDMGHLELQGNNNLNMISSNQMIISNNAQEMYYQDSSYQFKQEVTSSLYGPETNQNNQPMQGNAPPNPAAMQGMAQNGGTPMEGNMPPPPPYPTTFETSSQNDSTITAGTEIKQDPDEVESKHMCMWIDCNTVFTDQTELVSHIEKQHIDQKRGDDFTCYWAGCQRRQKPFNARYKLLIHMRVHSGERPNKCTVSTVKSPKPGLC